NNRMGIQLQEELPNTLDAILTGPVLPGTVQLTPSGKLIVLMRDGQTTGGYPRVLQLSEAGINALAQKLPGEKFRFIL
ncbi:MAG: allophanate hydrolase subunit 2 family protein, partial [Salinimicrobium sp.]